MKIDREKAAALSRVVKALGQTGDVDEALKVAVGMTMPRQEEMFRNILEVFAQENSLE